MFRFATIDALWGLAVVPVLLLLFRATFRARRRALQRFGDSPLVQKLSGSVSVRGRVVKAALLLATTALLVLALARPQFGSRVETVRSEGRDVMVVLDVSVSMLAEDVPPTRLDRAKLEIGRLIRGLDGDRVGLVAFAGNAFVQSPLTTDYAAALMFLSGMDTDLVSLQGTNLGAALGIALDAFEEGAGGDASVLVLITDGEDHEGEIDAAVERAREMEVEINTVGIGSPDGAPIPQLDESGRRTVLRDEEGNVVTTRLEEGTLRRIAEVTGGRYVPAYGGTQALQRLVDDIATGAGRELESRQVTQFEEQYQVFLGLAILLLLLEAAVPERKKMSEEWTGRFQ
ncbi:MAG TPA: VWA domain-containing protein [Longimicrobiales bacterium]|nr:VWA domain-containing protein [Longimicrobiales bacterium]